MQFNLIDEEWIPVKRRDGTETNIAPWQVTEGFAENPVVGLNAPRSDFNGALIQFLIGLVQTVAAPATKMEWKRHLLMPPTPDDLQRTFSTVRHAFELGGDGPRFMQDYEKLEVREKGIAGLLIDMPGKKTRDENKDHFVKRGTITCMCPSCCSTALFTMQTNSPEGGRGYLTSLRGGGPLTTLAVGDEHYWTLWHSIWLNVLPNEDFLNAFGNASKNKEADIFPWLSKTRTGVKTTPQDVHPAQVFWGMPRRISLNLSDCETGSCGVCGKNSEPLIVSYREKTQGVNYKGPWIHPLTPYFYKDNVPSAIHAQPGGVSYRHWLGFIQTDGKERLPAYVVHEFRENRQQADWQFRLWAFGYDMESNKPRCWYEAKMPLLHIRKSIRAEYENHVAGLIRAASAIGKNIRVGVKKAWFKRYRDIKGDTSFVDSSFWQNTEPAFYEALHGLKVALESGSDGMEGRKAWHEALCREAKNLFDAHAWEGPIEDADPKRVVIARREMEQFNRSNKIKVLLGLPLAQHASGKATRKKAAKRQN